MDAGGRGDEQHGTAVAIIRRLEKLRRFLRWRLRPGGLPVWWHVGRPNFGDDINPTLFAALGAGSVRFAADRTRPHVLGAGSILEHAGPAAVVCGSGFLAPPDRPVTAAEIVAVRGRRSAAAAGVPDDVLLGDPLVLIDQFVQPVAPRRRFGFVPHVTSVLQWRRLAGSGVHVIDPAWDPWRVVDEIAACETIFSQSLHGLIVADALGIPNVWVAPSDGMAGGRFKFDDYFSTIDRPKPAVPAGRDLFRSPERHDADVGRYRHCRRQLRDALTAACVRVAGGGRRS